MKKILIVTSISFFLISMNSFVVASNLSDAKIRNTSNSNQIITEEPKEQLYYNLFVTMLYPYVEKAIDNFYSEYMTYLPGEAPYSYNFIKFKKTSDFEYSYEVILEVQPYVGPHISVGRDRITFKIDLNGVKVEKFEHIECYKLPQNYQDILKKKLP